MDEFLERVSNVLNVDKDEISMDTQYGEFEGWDSLMMMRIILEVEEEYGCTIPIEAVANIKTLNDIYKYTLE